MGAYDPVPNRADAYYNNHDLDITGIDINQHIYTPKKKKTTPEPKYRVSADPSRGRRTLPWGQNHKTGNARD